MVKVTTQFSIKEGNFARFRDVVKRLVGRRMRNNFSDLRPLIKESIDSAVDRNKGKFIPTNSEAFELGIGEGGNIDTDKTNSAWTALLPSNPDSVTRFTVRKIGSERSGSIGQVDVFIDTQAFLNAPRSVVQTPDSDEISEIPWMEWFLFGNTISGVRFSSRRPIPITSRTGGGIMIEGGLWSFIPKGPTALPDLLNQARLEINRRLRSNTSASILRRRR